MPSNIERHDATRKFFGLIYPAFYLTMPSRMTIVDVLFHTCINIRNKTICSFLIFVPIDPKLPKAQDKTMQGVSHDINVVCKMSSPMSKGTL